MRGYLVTGEVVEFHVNGNIMTITSDIHRSVYLSDMQRTLYTSPERAAQYKFDIYNTPHCHANDAYVGCFFVTPNNLRFDIHRTPERTEHADIDQIIRELTGRMEITREEIDRRLAEITAGGWQPVQRPTTVRGGRIITERQVRPRFGGHIPDTYEQTMRRLEEEARRRGQTNTQNNEGIHDIQHPVRAQTQRTQVTRNIFEVLYQRVSSLFRALRS